VRSPGQMQYGAGNNRKERGAESADAVCTRCRLRRPERGSDECGACGRLGFRNAEERRRDAEFHEASGHRWEVFKRGPGGRPPKA